MTSTNPRFLLSLVAALGLLPCPAFAATAAASDAVIVTTVSGERFIGTPVTAPDDAWLHLVSQTVGEIRIPRSAVREVTPVGAAAPATTPEPAAPAPAVVAAPTPPPAPPAPPPGLLQRHLGVPGRLDVSVGLGVMAQSGQLEQANWTGSLDVAWTEGKNGLTSSYSVHRQTVHGLVVDDGMRWDVQARRDLDAKKFLLAASYFRQDTVMAVDMEEVLFAGMGWNLAKTPTFEAVTVVGPSYIWQEYLPPAPGLPAPADLGDPAAVIYQSLTYTAAPRVRLNGSVLVAQSVASHTRQLARLLLSLDIALSERLVLSNSYFWIIDSLPRNGSTKYQGTLSTQVKLKL